MGFDNISRSNPEVAGLLLSSNVIALSLLVPAGKGMYDNPAPLRIKWRGRFTNT